MPGALVRACSRKSVTMPISRRAKKNILRLRRSSLRTSTGYRKCAQSYAKIYAARHFATAQVSAAAWKVPMSICGRKSNAERIIHRAITRNDTGLFIRSSLGESHACFHDYRILQSVILNLIEDLVRHRKNRAQPFSAPFLLILGSACRDINSGELLVDFDNGGIIGPAMPGSGGRQELLQCCGRNRQREVQAPCRVGHNA